jgi:hypothetical protein
MEAAHVEEREKRAASDAGAAARKEMSVRPFFRRRRRKKERKMAVGDIDFSADRSIISNLDLPPRHLGFSNSVPAPPLAAALSQLEPIDPDQNQTRRGRRKGPKKAREKDRR